MLKEFSELTCWSLQHRVFWFHVKADIWQAIAPKRGLAQKQADAFCSHKGRCVLAIHLEAQRPLGEPGFHTRKSEKTQCWGTAKTYPEAI